MDPTATTRLHLPDGPEVVIGLVEHQFGAWPEPRPVSRFGAKPIVASRGRGVLPEVARVDLLRERGWDAVWASTYGGLRFLADQPNPTSCNTVPIPAHAEAALAQIAAVTGTHAGVFDVLAWRGERLCFVEAKRRGRGRIRPTQRAWLAAALAVRFPPAPVRRAGVDHRRPNRADVWAKPYCQAAVHQDFLHCEVVSQEHIPAEGLANRRAVALPEQLGPA